MLFLSMACLGAFLTWLLLREPIWIVGGFDAAYYVAHFEDTVELVSLVVNDEKKEYVIETRDLRDGRLLKTIALETPFRNSRPIVIGHESSTKCRTGILAMGFREELTFISRGVPNDGMTLSVFAIDSGKLLIQEKFGVSVFLDFRARGDRLAIPTPLQLVLVDASTSQVRKLELPGVRSVEVSPDGSYLACIIKNNLMILDWMTGKILCEQPFSEFQYRLNFTRDGSIVVHCRFPYVTINRWKWNGRELESVARNAILKPVDMTNEDKQLRVREDAQGLLRVDTETGFEFPEPYRSLRELFPAWKDKIASWRPMDFMAKGKILNYQLETLSEYEEVVNQQYEIGHGMHVDYGKADAPSKSIRVARTNPQWPNAMAAGVMMYVLCYVTVRCRNHIRGKGFGGIESLVLLP